MGKFAESQIALAMSLPAKPNCRCRLSILVQCISHAPLKLVSLLLLCCDTDARLGQELPSCLLGFLPSGQKLEQQHQMSRRLNALPASAADFVDSSVQDGLTQRWDNSLPELMVGDNCLKRQLIGDDASQFSDYDAEDRPPSCASVCVPSSEQQGLQRAMVTGNRKKEPANAKYCHKSTLVEGCTKRRTGSNRSIELHLCRVLASTVHQPKHRAFTQACDAAGLFEGAQSNARTPQPSAVRFWRGAACLWPRQMRSFCRGMQTPKLTQELFASVAIRLARACGHPGTDPSPPTNSHSFWQRPASACKLAIISSGQPCLSSTPLAMTTTRSASATVCRR